MKTFQEQVQEMHDEQTSELGFCGQSDVDIAREVYKSIEAFIDDASEAFIVLKIAKAISENRSY